MATRTPPGRPVSRAVEQRALGLMIGAAVGDALGAPFEFEPAGLYRQRFPTPVLGGIGEMVGGGGFGWAPGEFTDDTQMALALAESIVRSGGYDPDETWRWFRSWITTANDAGITTRTALRQEDWRTAATSPSRGAGNGALMRSFPFAVALLHADAEVVRDVVVGHGALTHPDRAAGWGAWLAVEMARRALHGRDPLDGVDELVARLPESVRPGFVPLLDETWTPDRVHPANGTVWGCLAEAVWALRTTTSFEDAVVAAVSLGGDADTVGCVTGALAGARSGVQAIPSRWSTYLNGAIDSPVGRLEYRAPDLQALTMRLLGLRTTSEKAPEPPAGPLEVAPGLHAADLLGAARTPTDWAVVSLCRTGDRFRGHPVRRQIFLVDAEGDHNTGLRHAVADAVAAIDAFLDEGRQVVVHCHGGRSRTGLVLKAWKMRRDGVDERAADEWLAERWHRYEPHNQTFLEFLRRDW